MGGVWGSLRLDLSFLVSVTPDHVGRVLDATYLKRADHLGQSELAVEGIAKVSAGRIAKVTSRAGFLAPLENWVSRGWRCRPCSY